MKNTESTPDPETARPPPRVSASDPSGAEAAAERVREGGVIVYPTETVYGLGCDPFRPEAVARVRAVKGRDAEKPMLAVTDRWERVRDWFSEVSTLVEPLLQHNQPVAVTLALPAGEGAPPALVGPEGLVAVRRSGDPFVAGLVAAAGVPVLSTSANRAGEPPAADFADLDASVLAAVDFAVDAGRPLGGVPSTVVTVRGGELVVLRPGAVPEAELRALLGA
jgi:L-threonylcarbamoyladenylate synthase